jgi:hypothetical protein
LFVEQYRPWEYHVSFHVKNVIRAIHQYNHKTLVYCCRDAELSGRLWIRLSQILLPSYRRALEQVLFLIDVEHRGNLLTMNHFFADNLRKARDRIMRKLTSLQSWATDYAQKEPLLRLEDIIAEIFE